MSKIKEMYSTPIVYLYDASRNLTNIFNTQDNYKTIYDVTLKNTMNESSELTFKILADNDRIGLDSCESMVKVHGDDTWYIIKTINNTNDDTSVIQVTAQAEEVSLKGILCGVIACTTVKVTALNGSVGTTTNTDEVIGTVTTVTVVKSDTGVYTTTTNVSEGISLTPLQMWNLIKTKAKSCGEVLNTKYIWDGSDIEPNIKRAIQVDDEQSVFENLLAIASAFEGWIEFNNKSDGTIHLFLRTKAIDNGKYIMKGKDLKELDITYDSTDIVTQLFAFGATDKISSQELNIMSVNPTKLSYIENYDYFLSLGMSIEQIKNEPRCLQQKIFRDDKFVRDIDLYNQTVIELNKVCVPKLTGSIKMLDFGVMEDTSISSPVIGENVKVINIDTKYVMSARVDSITRKFTENPFDIDITISNLIAYTSVFRDLVMSSTTIGKLTSTDGSGAYIPSTKVKDSEGLSLHQKLGDLESSFEVTEEHFQSKFDNWSANEHSLIEQNAKAITMKVSNDDFGTMMEQNAESWKYCFNHVSSYITFDENGIWCQDTAFGTGYTCMSTQGLVHMDNKDDPLGKPYHYLTWISATTVPCSGMDYTRKEIDIPPIFNHINPTDIAVTCSIKKIYDSNSGRWAVPYWFGAYASIGKGTNGTPRILVDAISVWRNFSTGEIFTDGLIDVSLTLVA